MYPLKEAVLLYDNVTPVTVTSSTDAAPIVVTATAHGFKTGQRVLIFGHATNVAANGISVVGIVTTNTFQLLDEITGASVAGSGGGAGSGGIAVLAPQIIHLSDFRNIILQIGTSGTATTTLKVAGSLGKPKSAATAPRDGLPNFGATVTPSNPYSFLQITPLDTFTSLAGATGLVIAGTDVNNMYQINVNGMLYLTVFPVSWTAGAITIKAFMTTNA